MFNLSTGICARFLDDNDKDAALFSSEHTVQILHFAPANPNQTQAPIRYLLMVSDGVHIARTLLVTQYNSLIEDKVIQKYAVVVIEKCIRSLIGGKKAMIVVSGLRVIGSPGHKIGNPQPPGGHSSAGAESSSSAAPQQPNPAVQRPLVQPPDQPRQVQPPPDRQRPIYPIEGLSPYQNNWTIKALVTQKSDVRAWSNQRGEGKLFNLTLMDDTGEIKATAFNAAVDELYDKLEEGKIYYISKARVNLAKKKFSNLANDYELGLERYTEVEECLEATNAPTIKYNFVSLSGLQDLVKDATCDVIAIVKEMGPLGEITSKQTNKQITKRELTLVDQSGFSVRITLWGKQAEQWSLNDNPVVAFKGARVGDFGGRSLSMHSGCTMSLNPNIDEAYALRGWFDSSGANQTFRAHTNTMGSGGGASFSRNDIVSVEDVKAAKLGENDQPDYFSIRGTIMHVKQDNIFYPGCPGRQGQPCSKRVVQAADGWKCDKCEMTHEKPLWLYRLAVAVADHSGQLWLHGFNDFGLALFGQTADVLHDIQEQSETAFTEIVKRVSCNSYNFACRAKMSAYNDAPRVETTVLKLLPLDYRDECQFLVERLRSAWAR